MAESTYSSSKTSGEEDNTEGGMISMVGLGVASFSLADAQIPCVTSTAHLEEQVDHDVERERKRKQSRRKTKRFILSQDVDPLNQKITIVVATVAVLGLVFALTVMYMEMSMVATIAFFFPLVTSPYVIYQRDKIQRLPCTYKESTVEQKQKRHAVRPKQRSLFLGTILLCPLSFVCV
jgi:hypothetical protein